MAIQLDGKIVAAGYANVGNGDFAVARFNPDGTLDTTFNAAGLQAGTVSTTIDNLNSDNEAYGVAIQSDGKIVAAGSARIGSVHKFAVARFNTATISNIFALALEKKNGPRG